MSEPYQILWNIANDPKLTYWVGWAMGLLAGFFLGKFAQCDRKKRP